VKLSTAAVRSSLWEANQAIFNEQLLRFINVYFEGSIMESTTSEKDKLAITDDEKKLIEDAKEILPEDLMKEEFNELPYELPDFEALCEDFDIEKAFDKDSSYLLREVRKLVMEKLSAYLQLFETFMNPASPPMFIFKVLRNVNNGDKEFVKEVYEELSKYQLWAVRLDTVYEEKNEAEFISKAFSDWQEMKKKIYSFLERLEKESESKDENVRSAYLN